MDVGLMEDTEMPLPVPGYREPVADVEVKHVPVKGKGYLHLQELARFRCVKGQRSACVLACSRRLGTGASSCEVADAHPWGNAWLRTAVSREGLAVQAWLWGSRVRMGIGIGG